MIEFKEIDFEIRDIDTNTHLQWRLNENLMSSTVKTNDFHPLRSFCVHTKCCLCCLVFAWFYFVGWFLLASIFYDQNLFVKKMNTIEIVRITSLYYTTVVLITSLYYTTGDSGLPRVYVNLYIFKGLFSYLKCLFLFFTSYMPIRHLF